MNQTLTRYCDKVGGALLKLLDWFKYPALMPPVYDYIGEADPPKEKSTFPQTLSDLLDNIEATFSTYKLKLSPNSWLSRDECIGLRKLGAHIPEDGIEEIEEVLKLLKESSKPVILGGHGIKLSKSENEFKTLLHNFKIPVLLTWSAIDLLDHNHPLFFGSPGIYGQRSANFIFQKCDLLIVLGSRLTLPQTGYDFKEIARSAKIVMIDIDLTEFKEFSHLQIHSDCGEFIKRINISYSRLDWINECASIRKEFPLIDVFHVDQDFPNSYRIIDKISNFITSDHTIVTDMGTALLSGHQVIRLKEGTKMFSSYGLGEMGYGLPAAFGAAIASNGREVLCLNCDGGMMMNIQ